MSKSRHDLSGMLDGREVNQTERQFLACWKASRKARKKALHKSTKSQMTGKCNRMHASQYIDCTLYIILYMYYA